LVDILYNLFKADSSLFKKYLKFPAGDL
jgi:hypothetical protein